MALSQKGTLTSWMGCPGNVKGGYRDCPRVHSWATSRHAQEGTASKHGLGGVPRGWGCPGGERSWVEELRSQIQWHVLEGTHRGHGWLIK